MSAPLLIVGSMEILVIIGVFLAASGLLVVGVLLFSLLAGITRNLPPATGEQNLETMNEGDFHSGPEGYSPNTAYPETQYGSMFDEDADWHDEEER
jgi:hypothetical protein